MVGEHQRKVCVNCKFNIVGQGLESKGKDWHQCFVCDACDQPFNSSE